MKIFGHPLFPRQMFHTVSSIEEIKKTPSNSLVKFKFLESLFELIFYCKENAIVYVLEIESIKEVIFAHNLGARFVVCEKKLAKDLMPIAQNYLFDTEILAYIKDEEEIEELAKSGVDGVLLI